MRIGFYEILIILGILLCLAVIIAVVVIVIVKLASGSKDHPEKKEE
jgi:hypothetical protein